MREIIRMLLSDGVFFLQDFPISRVGRFLFRIGLFREYYSIGGRFLKFFFCGFFILFLGVRTVPDGLKNGPDFRKIGFRSSEKSSGNIPDGERTPGMEKWKKA